MRLGSDSPLKDQHTLGLVNFKEEVERETQGRIKITIFPDAQLGGNEIMINSVKGGLLDGLVVDMGALTGAVPEADIFSMPFLLRDTPHALRAANGTIGAKLKPKIEQAFACHVLGWGTDGERNMWNSKRPIRTPDDLRGLKMRVQNSEIQKATYEAFGALPTPMSFSELYTALQTKVVDGADPGTVDMLSLKLYQVTKYLTLTKHFYIINVTIVSQAFMNKVSPSDQEIIRGAGKRASDLQATATVNASGTALKEMQAKGLQVFEMADPKAFVGKVEGVHAKMASRVGGAPFIEEARSTP